jgi:hypothetical protein
VAFAVASYDRVRTQLEMKPVARFELWCIGFRLNAPQAGTVLRSTVRKYVKRREIAVPLVSEKKRRVCPHGSWREIEQLPHRLMLAIRVESRKPLYLAPTKICARDHTGEQIFSHRLTPVWEAQRGVQTVIETANGTENTPHHGE